MPDTKIATCCYCGTRAALVLKGETRHELACSSCGAPLHELKRLPASHSETVRPGRTVRPLRARPKKKRKSLRRKVFEEIWDALEDVFD